MRYKAFLLITIFSLFSNSIIWSQKTKPKTTDKKSTTSNQPKVKPSMIFSYLGNSTINDGKISKKVFDSLLKQGLKAKDSLGFSYSIDGFMFNYGERNLYEDSVGNPIILTDLIMEYCKGDSLTPTLKNNIFYKTKPGDTAYFENIKVQTSWGQMPAKSMRLILTK